MHYFRHRFPLLYRFAALLALWSMFVPLATNLVHHPVAAQGLWRICGTLQPGNANPAKAPTHKMPECPICQGLQHLGNGFVPPDIVPVIAVFFAAPVYIVGACVFTLKPRALTQAQPRAPPAFV